MTGSIFKQRENPAVHGVDETLRVSFTHQNASRSGDGCESRTSGVFFPVWVVCTPNRGGMTAPMSGRSDDLGIPARLSQGIPCGKEAGYRRKTTRYLRIPHGIGVTGAWHSQHCRCGNVRSQRFRPSAVREAASESGSDCVRGDAKFVTEVGDRHVPWRVGAKNSPLRPGLRVQRRPSLSQTAYL